MLCAAFSVTGKTVSLPGPLFRPEGYVGEQAAVANDAGRCHPCRQCPGAGQADHRDHQDDEHPTFALITRQMREQQFARAFYKIFSHSFMVLLFRVLLFSGHPGRLVKVPVP